MAILITDEMLQAAVAKAVEVGLLPKHSIGEDAYMRSWTQIKDIIQAALNKSGDTAMK